jgi:hypothetical protein
VNLDKELILGGEEASQPPPLRPPATQLTHNIFCDRFRPHKQDQTLKDQPLKQIVFRVVTSDSQRFQFFFAAAGDKLNALAYYELIHQYVVP